MILLLVTSEKLEAKNSDLEKTTKEVDKLKRNDAKVFEQNDEKTTEVSEQNPTLIDTPAVVDRDEKEVDSEPVAEAPIEIDEPVAETVKAVEEPVIENKIKTEIPIIREDLVNDKPLLETKEIAEPEIKTEIPIIQEDLVNDEPLLETQEIAEPEIVEPIWPKAEIVESRVQVNPNDFEKEYTINVKEEQFNKSWFHEISKRDLPEHLKIRCYYVRISFLH